MKIVRHTAPNFSRKLAKWTARSSLFDPVIEQRTRAIIDAVQMRGDDALLEFTENLTAPAHRNQLAVTQAELHGCVAQADDALARRRGRGGKKHRQLREEIPYSALGVPELARARVGEKFDPFQRVGAYIPVQGAAKSRAG